MNLEEIKQKVKQVLEFSQEQNDLYVENLIQSWEIAKDRFITAFGEKLIYEYPEKVSFELTQTEKEKKVDEFVEFVGYRYGLSSLCDFLNSNIDCFFSNSLKKPYKTYDLETGEPITIQAGTKLVKAFKYFVENKELLELLQNKASTIIQEDKISGTLCLSVHPLDYLSLSENINNWRSCHALDGEYRSGNLSYMVDNCTIICYLKSDQDVYLPRFPGSVKWNNKKWRVLLFIPTNKSMLFLGRQYPFVADKAADFITKFLLPKCGLFARGTTWTDWTAETVNNVELNNEKYFLWEKYIPVGGTLKTYQDLIKPGNNALNFNDLLNSSCYVPMYCYTIDPIDDYYFFGRDKYGNANTVFTVGGQVLCLKCGQQAITNSATVLCNDCEETYGHLVDDDFAFCTVCGCHTRTDNGVYINDQFVCSDCADTETSECDRCGFITWRDEMYYNERTGELLCKYCYDDE